MSLTSKLILSKARIILTYDAEGGSHDESRHDSAAGEDETGEC